MHLAESFRGIASENPEVPSEDTSAYCQARIGALFSIATGAAIAVVTNVLNTHDIKLGKEIGSPKDIASDLLTVIPQFVKPETTAKIPQCLGEVVDVLAFYRCTEKLNLLKQWVMDDHCRLVAVLEKVVINKISVRSTSIQRG